jgi:hypothetical protein
MRSPGTVVFYVLLVMLATGASVQYGLGRLPGDIIVDVAGSAIYLPITTTIVVAAVLGVIFWLVRRR